jgi:uncharacterized protein involved in exopolysaccharide biosynthesis
VNRSTDLRETGTPASERDYAFRVYPVPDSGALQLADLWFALWGGRWWLLSSIVLGIVTAVVSIILITPRYRAEAVLSVVNPESATSSALGPLASQLGGLAAIAGVNLGAQDTTAEAIATLSSRAFTEGFIDRHGMVPILFADIWNAETQTWDVDDPADVPTLWKAYDRFDKSVRTVSQDATTGLLTLTIDWTDPQLAADWGNALVDEANEALRSKAREQAEKNIEYLTKELETTSSIELRAALYGLMETEMRKDMLASVTTEYAFKTIDPAIVPEKVYWPNRILLLVLGPTVFLVMAIFFIFVRRSLAAAR